MAVDRKFTMIDISIRTILKIVLLALILLFIYLIKNVVYIFVVSIIFASILIPLIDYLENKKIPRTLSVVVIYVGFLSLIGLAFYLVIPIVASQVSGVAANLGIFFNKFYNILSSWFGFQSKDLASYTQSSLESLSGQLSSLTSNIYNLTVRVVAGVVTAIIIIVLAFYLTIEQNASSRLIRFFAPRNKQKKLVALIDKAQRRMGLWLGGQLIMSFIIFVLSFIAFLILRLPNAFTLALIMGILELIPYFGPLIGGAAAAFVAFSQSLWLGIVVIIVIILIQQIENHVLMPNVMKKVTGLSPVIVILAILIGAELFGFIGVIIAIPITMALSVILQEYFSMNDKGIVYKPKEEG